MNRTLDIDSTRNGELTGIAERDLWELRNPILVKMGMYIRNLQSTIVEKLL